MRDEGLGLSLSGNMEGERRDEGLGLSLSGKISRLLINVKQRPRHSPPQPADCPGPEQRSISLMKAASGLRTLHEQCQP